jgi:hypothetical protein
MLYHGAIWVSAAWYGDDIAASAQITAKINAEVAVLARIFLFTSSIQPYVFYPGKKCIFIFTCC